MLHYGLQCHAPLATPLPHCRIKSSPCGPIVTHSTRVSCTCFAASAHDSYYKPHTPPPTNPITEQPNNPTTQQPGNPATQRPNNPTTQAMLSLSSEHHPLGGCSSSPLVPHVEPLPCHAGPALPAPSCMQAPCLPGLATTSTCAASSWTATGCAWGPGMPCWSCLVQVLGASCGETTDGLATVLLAPANISVIEAVSPPVGGAYCWPL